MAGLSAVIALALATAALPSVRAGDQDAGDTEVLAVRSDAQQRMTVPVRIGGDASLRFMIDTGAQNTIVSNVVAARLALPPSGTASVVGVAGTLRVDTVAIKELGLGRRSFTRLVAPILAAEDIGADGIVGLDSLQDQRILIDFARNTIAIDDAARPVSDGYDIVVRARRRSGQLIITAATLDGVRCDVVIDTGADGSIGNRPLQAALARRGVQALGSITSVTGQQIPAAFGYARTLVFGDASIANVSIAYADAPPFAMLGLDKRPALLLGMRELRAFKRVAIDFSRRQVLFAVADQRKQRALFD